jgi:hypothetical protein
MSRAAPAGHDAISSTTAANHQPPPRHCEERSDAAIHSLAAWIAASLALLAMTAGSSRTRDMAERHFD